MADSDRTTQRLVEEWQTASNRAAVFRHLFERFHRPVLYFFARRGLSSEESQDLAQDTFLAVYRGMGNFRHDASIETWLFKIAANTWRSAMRSRSRVKRSADEVSLDDLLAESSAENAAREKGDEDARRPELAIDPDESSSLQEVLDQERTALLRRAIDELPVQMRNCLSLRLFHGLKYREIAEVMQVSIDTVKSQLFQARARLKQELADRFSDIDSSS